MKHFIYTRLERWERKPAYTTYTMRMYQIKGGKAVFLGDHSGAFLAATTQATLILKAKKALPKKYFEATRKLPDGRLVEWHHLDLEEAKVCRIESIT